MEAMKAAVKDARRGQSMVASKDETTVALMAQSKAVSKAASKACHWAASRAAATALR
jgi:hypothetical protein